MRTLSRALGTAFIGLPALMQGRCRSHDPRSWLCSRLVRSAVGRPVSSFGRNHERRAGGGFTLARMPAKLRILEIVQAVDPICRITTCPLGLAAHGKRLCPLHKRLEDALTEMEKAFAASTLAEILAEPTRSVPLCNFPAAPAGR
ncbi:MAG: Rrf2 family transcriptional regulator [Planctomycetia bacterium]